jgi:hypothetical protein
MSDGDEDELRQTDLSELRIHEMTPAQRAELKRRYQDFVRHFDAVLVPPAVAPKAHDKPIRKWVPGAKR